MGERPQILPQLLVNRPLMISIGAVAIHRLICIEKPTNLGHSVTQLA